VKVSCAWVSLHCLGLLLQAVVRAISLTISCVRAGSHMLVPGDVYVSDSGGDLCCQTAESGLHRIRSLLSQSRSSPTGVVLNQVFMEFESALQWRFHFLLNDPHPLATRVLVRIMEYARTRCQTHK
jgi:hypothetical protein